MYYEGISVVFLYEDHVFNKNLQNKWHPESCLSSMKKNGREKTMAFTEGSKRGELAEILSERGSRVGEQAVENTDSVLPGFGVCVFGRPRGQIQVLPPCFETWCLAGLKLTS